MDTSREETERVLWERAQAGDKGALEEVLRLHEDSIYRFGLRLCGDEEAAKEVLQRTLLTAFEKLDSFRGEAKLSTWLYALARSACGRLHRRTRSAPLHDRSLDAPEAPLLLAGERPDEAFESAQLADAVAVAISLLPEKHREAVVLRDVEGLPAEEAALIAGLSVAALKSRLHRGREELRTNLVTLLRESPDQFGRARACPRLADRLARLGPGELNQAACKSIEAHLGECPSCAEALGDLKDAASLCRRLPSGHVPPAVQRAVRAAITTAIGR